MFVTDQNALDAPDANLKEGEWYLDDQDAIDIADITFFDGEWYLNDGAVLDVTYAAFDGGEWYLNKIKDLAYLSSCASNSACTDTYSDICMGTILGNNSEMGDVRPNRQPWHSACHLERRSRHSSSLMNGYTMQKAPFSKCPHKNKGKCQSSLAGSKSK